MKATAKHWINYNGVWHQKGEVFAVNVADADALAEHCDLTQAEAETLALIEEEAPKRRGRPRKSE